MEEKVPPQKVYVPECFIVGFRGHPHGLETRGDLDTPRLVLALLDLAGRPSPPNVTLRTIVRKFIDPNISGGQNYITGVEVAELVNELFVGEKHVGVLATLQEVNRLGYSHEELEELRKEYLRIDRVGAADLAIIFGCWPPKPRY